ncbi:MAG: hypothetical protein AAFY66_10645 [Pseudomonadota bacterium]
MLLIEILAALGLVACLARVVQYAWQWERQLILPIGIYLTVATMLGFAAFGGESGLVTDWETMLMRALGAGALGAIGFGYWRLVAKARARAAEKETPSDGGPA